MRVSFIDHGRLWVCWLMLALAGVASGQEPASPSDAYLRELLADPAPSGLIEVGCIGCQSGLLSAALPAPELPAALGTGPPSLQTPLLIDGCGCGDGRPCVPGRKACHPCEANTWVGRFCCALYDCICCPDPCYEGRWTPLADSALFCEGVRPITQSKLRWESGPGFLYPDRSEYFWARADGQGRGPKPTAPLLATPSLRYNELIMVNEGGTGAITMTIEQPYREVQAEPYFHSAGFSDMSIMTKTLLFDCELLQFSMLFRTYIPLGNPLKGLGTGHVTLEPGGVVGLKLTPTTYLQTQVSQWIPLGGSPDYAGSILHYHGSLNQVLWRIMPDVPLIGTLECAGYSFQTGKYTDPFLGSFQKSSGYTYLYAGGGARLFVCDKVDFGFGGLFAMSDQHFAREIYRMEFRVRW
ncbi:MAG: hypothetical protein U0840_16365 [Gemmataceae bacterium]